MGIYASYYSIDAETARRYQRISEEAEAAFEALRQEMLDDTSEADDIDAFIDTVTENEAFSFEDEIAALEAAEGRLDSVALGRYWDGLHFLLSGFNGDLEHNEGKTPHELALYHAFFGQDMLSLDGAYLVRTERVPAIVAALEAADIDRLLTEADFDAFAKAEIYPDIWDEDAEDLKQDLAGNFADLFGFYRRAAEAGRGVLITLG